MSYLKCEHRFCFANASVSIQGNVSLRFTSKVMLQMADRKIKHMRIRKIQIQHFTSVKYESLSISSIMQQLFTQVYYIVSMIHAIACHCPVHALHWAGLATHRILVVEELSMLEDKPSSPPVFDLAPQLGEIATLLKAVLHTQATHTWTQAMMGHTKVTQHTSSLLKCRKYPFAFGWKYTEILY